MSLWNTLCMCKMDFITPQNQLISAIFTNTQNLEFYSKGALEYQVVFNHIHVFLTPCPLAACVLIYENLLEEVFICVNGNVWSDTRRNQEEPVLWQILCLKIGDSDQEFQSRQTNKQSRGRFLHGWFHSNWYFPWLLQPSYAFQILQMWQHFTKSIYMFPIFTIGCQMMLSRCLTYNLRYFTLKQNLTLSRKKFKIRV